MILPHEFNGSLEPEEKPEDGKSHDDHGEPHSPPPTGWKIKKLVEVIVFVSANDAQNPDDAIKEANSLVKDLELKVTVGGVLLPARFVK